MNYLLPHEHFVIVVRKHPGVYFGHFLIVMCWCAGACLVTALTESSVLVLGTIWGVFAVLAVWLAVRAVAWLGIYFVATDARLIFITGLVTHKVVSVPLREVNVLEGRRSPLGRVLGYGQFFAEPATPGYAIPTMKYMPYPEQLLAEIYGLLHPEGGED